MFYRLTAFLLVVAAPISARNQVWIVSGDNCPDVNFTTVQGAVDIASDGDTILLRAAPGSVFGPINIFQKSLTIVGAETNQSPASFSTEEVIIRGLLPSQSVTLIGIPRFNGERGIFENNQGSIWIEDGRFGPEAGLHDAPFFETVRILNCASINFVNVPFSAPQVTEACPPGDPCLGVPGNTSIRVINSEVNLYDCPLGGGAGSVGNDGLQFEPAGGTGGPGIRLENSTANIYGSFVIGGAGGVGGQNLPAPFCSDGGAGGSAIYLADTNSHVRVQDSTILGGTGGKWTTAIQPPNGCVDGAPGVPFGGPGAANVTVLPDIHKVAAFESNHAVREGQVDELNIEAGPDDLIFLGVAGTFESTFVPALFGTTAIQPLTVINLGTAGNSGSRTIPLLIGDVTTPGQSITVYIQAYFFNNLLQLSLSAPTALAIVDSSHDIYDGCDSTIRVDDDAPGDPGPGNVNVSDPLEDGSLLHPFDSIQEAIDSVKYIDSRIILADGTYVPPFSTGFLTDNFTSYIVESENGPANCIIDSGGGNTIFEFIETPFITGPSYGLRGLTFTGATDSAVITRFVDLPIDNCIFENNSGANGGGLRIAGGSPTVTNCIFRNNSVTSRGGGLFVNNTKSTSPSNPTITNCSIYDNSALSGGGLSVRNTSLHIQGSTIANNIGGGIEYRKTFLNQANVQLENSIVWGNTGDSEITILNHILGLSYSDVDGGLSDIAELGTATLNVGLGLIDIDPTFVNPGAGDFHLLPGSPCIDMGNPAFVPQAGEVDIDGEPRLQGSAVDLGSDEL
jgi:hypothetical protein